MSLVFTLALWLGGASLFAATSVVPKFGMHEVELRATGEYANPYTELSAEAVLTEPNGTNTRSLPLFWDGASVWKFRFSPDRVGTWRWTVQSRDKGLDGRTGTFRAANSNRKGSIRPMRGFPDHFERQDGTPFWFLGDTAWALYTDSREEKHDRQSARRFLDARARQGFNVVHSMLLSEAGWGNFGRPPFDDLAAEKINPGYWQEVDERLAYANRKEIVCGLALAWGDKRRGEPFAWGKFPSLDARKRYARYIAARYGAFDVYFLVSGEWHAEIRGRAGATEDTVRREFIDIGDALKAADAHGRMIAIHPMTSHGSVREFNAADWMSFGDYQQNYRDLHERVLLSRTFNKPVVNGEYGYLLRDQSGDGVPDKDNSTSLESMRHATWDLVMAGAYAVTGFGTTYFGGNRDPGPFDPDAVKNKPWEKQMGHIKKLFTVVDWWKLAPHDELLQCMVARGADTRQLGQIAPPASTYWCLAEVGQCYLVYVRGLNAPVELSINGAPRNWRIRLFNPRTGRLDSGAGTIERERFRFQPPDEHDWLVLLTRARSSR